VREVGGGRQINGDIAVTKTKALSSWNVCVCEHASVGVFGVGKGRQTKNPKYRATLSGPLPLRELSTVTLLSFNKLCFAAHQTTTTAKT